MLRFVGSHLLRIATSPQQPPIISRLPCITGHRCFCTVEPNHGDDKAQSGDKIVDLATLLKSTEKKNLGPSAACHTVIAMARLKKESKVSESEYVKDERFLKLIKLLGSNETAKVEPLAIISSLKALSELGVDSESFSVKNLENNLTWATRSCPIKDLVMMLSFTMTRRETENQKLLFNEVCKSLERRWVEIKNGGLFVSLLHYAELFSPQFIAKLEDRIADLVEEISPGDLVSILSELGRKKRRNVPLLKTITHYIVKHKSVLNIKQTSDCLFALNKLSYKDPSTLQMLCDHMETLIQDTESPAVLRSVLISLGQLKYLHTPVLDRIMDWHKARLEKNIAMSTKDMTTLMMTCATLNYNPVQSNSLLEHVSSSMRRETVQCQDQVWLDIVWALALLGRATSHHLESVLSPSFYTSFVYDTTSRNTQATMKLLNINAAAQLLMPGYTGPTIKVVEDGLLRDIKVIPSLAKVQFSQSVMEAFSTLFPPPRLLRPGVPTLLGCVAEAEFVCDSSARPLPVQELSSNFGSSESVTALPTGAHRLALLTAGYQDCVIGGELSGITAFNTQLIEAAGYKVLLVKYTEWDASSKLVTKVKMLDDKLKHLLGVKEEV